MIAFSLDRVSVSYNARSIFKDLSWEIYNDRCVGLVGPNGAGKSTLLRLISGELKSETGFANARGKLSIGNLLCAFNYSTNFHAFSVSMLH